MGKFDICYYTLLVTAIALSFFLLKKGYKHHLFLTLVLTSTLLTEIIAKIILTNRLKGFFVNIHIFNLVEYSLFTMYYLRVSQKHRFKLWAKISIPVFIVCGLCVSFFIDHFNEFPVLNIDLEGFLLFIIYTHLLLNLDDEKNMAIYMYPDFWVSIGILIFFGGAFVFFGLYPILHHLNPYSAFVEYSKILQPLNIIFYICIILGLTCSIHNRKYLIR